MKKKKVQQPGGNRIHDLMWLCTTLPLCCTRCPVQKNKLICLMVKRCICLYQFCVLKCKKSCLYGSMVGHSALLRASSIRVPLCSSSGPLERAEARLGPGPHLSLALLHDVPPDRVQPGLAQLPGGRQRLDVVLQKVAKLRVL